MPRATLALSAVLLALACGDGASRAASSATDSIADAPPESAAQSPGDSLDLPWWVSWRVAPRDTVIEGIPVRALDSTWTAATALASVAPPPESLDTADTFRRLGARFTTDGDFNRDGRPDRALVGTYRNDRGEEGRFVAVLTRSEAGGWARAWVYRLPGAPAFSALIDGRRGNTVTWIECMECDTSTDIRWRGGRYEAVVHSCCDDPPRVDTTGGRAPPEDRAATAGDYMLSQ